MKSPIYGTTLYLIRTGGTTQYGRRATVERYLLAAG